MTDYISKNKADWLFQEIFCNEEYCGGSCYKCGKEVQYRNKLLQEPAADVQPIRHGRWICNEELYFNGMTKCSCCNEEYYTEDIQNLQGDLRTVNYCPNCGARMDLND